MDFNRFNNVFILVATVFIFLSLQNISCLKKSKSSDNEVLFDTIQINESPSVDYNNSKLNCNLHISFTFPISCKKSSQLVDLQKMFIENIFPPQFSNLTPVEAVKSFTNSYISDFQTTNFSSLFEDDFILEDENNFIFELNLENEILYNRNNFISFVVKRTEYEGGAHGSNSIYGYVIDLNTGKYLTEEDFAGNNYKKNLSTIIVQKIASAKELSDVSQLESIGYNSIDDIVPNDNFIIDDKGITYYFNEYKIAAHFIGITEVFISYEELKSYITFDSPISSLAGL